MFEDHGLKTGDLGDGFGGSRDPPGPSLWSLGVPACRPTEETLNSSINAISENKLPFYIMYISGKYIVM